MLKTVESKKKYAARPIYEFERSTNLKKKDMVKGVRF